MSHTASVTPPRHNAVRERLIAALVPDAVERRELIPPAPLPPLPALRRVEQAGPVALLVVTARMDRSGRVHERILLRALGWEPGHRLKMDTVHDMIVVAAMPTGRHVIDHRGAIGLPVSLRRLCGIEAGPPLVLAATVREQVLVIHPAAIVARLLGVHYTTLIGVYGDG